MLCNFNALQVNSLFQKEQGIFRGEQGIFSTDQGIFRRDQGIQGIPLRKQTRWSWPRVHGNDPHEYRQPGINQGFASTPAFETSCPCELALYKALSYMSVMKVVATRGYDRRARQLLTPAERAAAERGSSTTW